ncbi:MAG: protoporphyrinogen oxidase [Candidatus Tectimicrobiota bacterium]
MPDTASPKRVIVVGGGITGLTVCYRLQRAAQEQGLALDVRLLEASGRLGGLIGTAYEQDCVLEQGPDCFLAAKPWGMRLCEDLGLTSEMIGTTAQHRQSFIVRDGRLLPVPQGFYLMVPGSCWSLLTTPVFSWPGKLRMALDLVLPRRQEPGDESLAAFVTRRLGREALERMAQPMIGGIYTADPQYLSMQATMPQFLEMEQQHGSLIRAMLTRQRAASQPPQGTSGPRYGLFVSFRRGMQTLIDALADRLPAESVQLNTPVSSLRYCQDTRRWLVQRGAQPTLEAEALCLCLPAPRASQLLAALDAPLATALQTIPYASSAILNIICRRSAIAHPLHGMGFVVPAVEQAALIACSFSSVKFAGRAPQEHVLLRAFVGGALQAAQLDGSDADIQQRVYAQLQRFLGITGPPQALHLVRHTQSMPQYHIGHLERIGAIEARVQQFPGLMLAGNAYRGVGIPDAIHSADTAARALLGYLVSPGADAMTRRTKST